MMFFKPKARSSSCNNLSREAFVQPEWGAVHHEDLRQVAHLHALVQALHRIEQVNIFEAQIFSWK